MWNPTTLNTVIIRGDNSYSTISQCINKNYLSLADVLEFVYMNNITFHLEFSNSFSWEILHVTVNNYPIVALKML